MRIVEIIGSSNRDTLPLVEFVGATYCLNVARAIVYLGVVPPLHILNQEFAKVPEAGTRWAPFEIDQAEYDELVNRLSSNQCVVDQTLAEQPDYSHWYDAAVERIRTQPDHRPLSWVLQNDLLGIPVGEAQWLRLNRRYDGCVETNVDSILQPLQALLYRLQHCDPDCCSLSAYDFFPATICEQADALGRSATAALIDHAIIDVQEVDPKYNLFGSNRLNAKLHRDELLTLLRHLLDAIAQGDQASV